MGDYIHFIKKIKALLNLDLHLYKETQMKRRLTSFREKKGFQTFQQLYAAMKNDPTLQAEFLDKVTINVSEFFRNYQRWEILEQKILPKLLKHQSKINVWSAACSTGEEPYTLGIILAKYLPLQSFSILATDIDEAALKKAKIGRYAEHSLKEVPNQMKEKHFTKVNSNEYEISHAIKQAIIFRREDLFQSAYRHEFDLIVCRNVLIYFTEEAKQMLYYKFYRALKNDGIRFVGSTEQIFQPHKYGVATEDTFFYRKISPAHTP